MRRAERSIVFYALAALAFTSSVAAQEEIAGVWLLNGPGTESEIVLTEAGDAIRNAYDLLSDDPSLYCTPASASRIWANPNSRIKIEFDDAEVRISYELFDLRRVIPLGDESAISDKPSTRNLSGSFFAEMGSSFAHFEADALVIESRQHVPGYIRTSRGIPQGTGTIAYEELRIVNGELHITHTYIDPALYMKPLVLTYSYRREDVSDVDIYNCTDANYDWFLELNNN